MRKIASSNGLGVALLALVVLAFSLSAVWAEQFSNFGLTTLAATIGSTDTSLTVVSTANFPTSAPFRITIQDSVGSTPEIDLVTAISGNTYTVTRGYEGTTATGHSAGAQVGQFVTAGVITDMYPAQRVVTSCPVNMTAADQIVEINQASGSCAVTGPSNPVPGKTYTIKDGGLNAATYPITLNPASGTIDGSASITLNQNGQALSFESNGSNLRIKSNYVSIVNTFTAAVCSLMPTTCGAFFGYSDPLWYGAIPNNGSVDNSPALRLAQTDACTGGWKRIKYTSGKYNFQSQVNKACHGETIFADPQNLMYDGNNPNSAVELYVNSGYFTTANHCFLNDNGYVDTTEANINFGGDGGQNGITDLCNSFNYTGSGQIPRHYLFNVGFSGTGTAWGCGLNTSGSGSSFPTPYTGSGNTCSNYMGVRAYNVTVAESALAANGNLTDTFWRGGEAAGNACGVIVGANVGTANVIIDINRAEENGYGGMSGVCKTAVPAFEVNGPGWNITTQFEGNNGPAGWFDGNYANDSINGGQLGSDGQAGVLGAESEFVFDTSSGSHPGVSINGAQISTLGGFVAPKYGIECLGTADISPIGIVGGNWQSALFSSGFINNSTETCSITPLVASGQNTRLPGPLIAVKTSAYAVQASDDGTLFTNTGATGSVTFTLPTASAGHNSCFVADAAYPLVIAADSGHTIRNGTSVTAASGNFTSNGTQGEMLCVKALNSSEWYVNHITGSWTVN
jgi:hypothetical protein